MEKRKIIFFILSAVCFSIASVYINKNDTKDITQGSYDECVVDQIITETIQKEDKIGVNTNLTIKTLYTICGHEIDEYVNINNNYINKNYEQIKKMFPDDNIVEFNNKHVTIQNTSDTYCPYHYVLVEENGKIVIYKEISEDKKEVFQTLDVLVSNLRQNDQYMFKNNGIRIYGKEKLYQFIEDFDS